VIPTEGDAVMDFPSLFMVIAVIVLIFLACREIVCWYFKLNRLVELLEEISVGIKALQVKVRGMNALSPIELTEKDLSIERSYQELTNRGMAYPDVVKKLIGEGGFTNEEIIGYFKKKSQLA
jgi:hypothetical protein